MRACAIVAALSIATSCLAAPSKREHRPFTPTLIGTFGDWKAAYHPESGVKVCYAYTFAKKSWPGIAGRDRVVLTIAQRPRERDSVAIGLGFPVLPHAGATVVANGKTLHLYLEGRSAFAPHGAEAIAAFGGGREAVGHFPGPRAVLLTDTFSLNGFAAAYAATLKECPKP